MKTITLPLTALCILLICHGCASNSPVLNGHGTAELVDLGNGICRQSNGLMWQRERSKKFSSFEEADAYAGIMNLGGYSDWRLPTKDELYRLCDLAAQKRDGDCALKTEGSFWSKNGKEEAGEWYPYPLCAGYDFKYLKSRTGRVRAVRP